MGFPLTEQQRSAVDHRGSGLLVSAAAGSGKTRVLVERLLDRVSEEGEDITSFLVITYTKAAAAELKGRIAQELSARLAERPHDRHLRRQTTLVYRAQISTIHSFCSTLLRESAHLLELDPDFRLVDEGEAHVMMARVLGEVMDRQYENIEVNHQFGTLVDTLAAGRDDSRLEQIVLDIFGRIQSHPDPISWLQEQSAVWTQAQTEVDVGSTIWGEILLKEAHRQAKYDHAQLAMALELCGNDPVLELNYGSSIQESLRGVAGLVAAFSIGWDAVSQALPILFPTAGRKKGISDEAAADEVKSTRTRCKKRLEKLEELFEYTSESELHGLAIALPAVQGLMVLVEEFTHHYEAEKRSRGVLDFSDLEHLVVKLLLDENSEATPLAGLWSQRFLEVMVDEYQDTNEVQNAIFTAVSQGGNKLFMVGDVKQSIYRFRLADPTIFLGKYRSFPTKDRAKAGENCSVVLTQNFRSRPEVLLACNDVFSAIMSEEFGELDYTEDQALAVGLPLAEDKRYRTELSALDLSCLKTDGERENKDLLEARWMARRIKTLLNEPLMISEGGTERGLLPSDVMILLRSPNSVLHHYMSALGEEGIPWSAEGGGNFFDATEIRVALSLLRVVDNPRQDVPLIATLRSPIYRFSGDKLALLRAGAKGDFYTALLHGATEGDEDCVQVLAELDDLRFGAGDRTCRQLIWHIYEKTNLLGLFGGMDRGEERRGNLLSLYALAGQMEGSGCRTLFQFLLRLDRLQETGGKITTMRPQQEGGGITIMSIHRSKGLEKPVVLLGGLSRMLNRMDLQKPVLFHPKLGVGPKGLDRERMIEYPTVARSAVAKQLEREMMAEELRLLYVAMTRAREKLILSVTLPDGEKTLAKFAENMALQPAPMALSAQQSVGAWVLLYAMTRPEATELRKGIYWNPLPSQKIGPAWDIHLVEGTPYLTPSQKVGQEIGQQHEQTTEYILPDYNWVYPYEGAVDAPSKLTATQLKGRSVDQELAEEGREMTAQKMRPLEQPNFMTTARGLTPAQRGTAIHLAMQYLSLDGDHSVEGVVGELDRLVAGGFLTTLQREAVNPIPLARFLSSPLGAKMAAASICQREFKFSILVSAAAYCEGVPEGEQVLLQGVVDCWFEDEDGITIVDFKSDRVTEETAKTHAEGYRPQLMAYSNALEEILKRPVNRCILWFFATHCQVEVAIDKK